MRGPDKRFDWDVSLGRAWVRVLCVAYVLPIAIPAFGSILWIWPWTAWKQTDVWGILQTLLPVGLGVVAWILLGLPRRRLRGALLFLACAASMLLPVGQVFRGLGDNSMAWGLLLRIGWQALAITLGLALVVAGNRQQKRTLGHGIAPWLVGVGGLAILAVFFVPIGLGLNGGGGGRGPVVAAVFLEREAWAKAWPVLVWMVGLAGLGVAGALSPLAARISDSLQTFVENAISRLARLLPITLPIVVLGLYIAHGAPGLAFFFLLFAKIVLHGYAVVVLMTIGLARLLDGATPACAARLLPEDQGQDSRDAEPAASRDGQRTPQRVTT